MSDEHIDRSMIRPPTANEAAQRATVEATVVAAQRAIGAYWAVQQKIPLFLVEDRMIPQLPPELLINARLLPQRAFIFDHVGKGGTGVEIGTQTGAFAKTMLERAQPARLHIIDVTYEQFDHAYFSDLVSSGRVIPHEGYSWDVMGTFPDDHFDWLYLDASHAYEHVARDMDACWRKVRVGGYFICNDFTNWSPMEMTPYGVMLAVCEFLLRMQGRFEVAFLALHRLGYHDIALRRLTD